MKMQKSWTTSVYATEYSPPTSVQKIAISAEITTDMLMLMSTITLSVAPVKRTVRFGQVFILCSDNTDVSLKLSVCYIQCIFIPKADKMAADQKISPSKAGIKSRPPILFPQICWNGSSIVTQPLERMGFAKNNPPGRKDAHCQPHHILHTKLQECMYALKM